MAAQVADFLYYVPVGFALVLAVEGLIYALFPAGMKRLFALMLDMPVATLRLSGLLATIAGLGLLGLLLTF